MLCGVSFCATAYAEKEAVMIVNENFSAYSDGATPSDEWVMDYTTGADIKEGAIALKARSALTQAAYEIPFELKKHIKDSEHTLTARIKTDGDECGILYATDKDGKLIFCIEPDLIKQGEWNNVTIYVRPLKKNYDIYINDELVKEEIGYKNSDASGTDAVRFYAYGDTHMSVESFVIKTYNDDAVAAFKTDFKDVGENSWARKYIMRLASEGIMLGTGDDTFSPKETMTVAQTAAILCRIFNINTAAGENWYDGAMEEMKKREIYTLFTPYEAIMRKDICNAAAMLLKERGIVAKETVKGKFIDLDGLTAEEEESIILLESLGVISGISETELAPYAYVTREQAARIFSSLIDVM